MSSIAILGFFILIIVFFYLGRNDFGLKPTSAKKTTEKIETSKKIESEEIKS